MATWKGSTTSPWYTIPAREIVSVEHPCVVKNVDQAIGTLQRGPGIAEIWQERVLISWIFQILDPTRPHAAATLSLNPDDGMSRPLFSTSKPANNMLLRVSVPKRTGRKRKRGSQDPYVDDARSTSTISSSDSGSLDAKQLLRRLRDNAGRYDVEVVGRIDRMHVFRGRVLWSADMGVDADEDPGVPDFVYSTTASPFMTKFRENIMPFECPFLVLSRDAPLMLVPDEKLKEFDLDMSKGATSNVDIVPPPSFSLVEMPFKYTYRQNPSVKQALNPSGETMTINTQQITKVFTHLVPCDVPSVPTEPNDKLPPIDTLDAALKKTIGILQKLFDDRPAWTRRGLRNHLTTNDQKYTLRTAVPYVGYIFRSGPWRDAILKFGYDPRTTPDSRIYQTLMFRIPPSTEETEIDPSLTSNMASTSTTTPLSGRRYTAPRPSQVLGDANVGNTSHVFTGHPPLARDGKTWMICDIHDATVTQQLSPLNPDAPPPRPVCDIYSAGWYGNVLLATARAIMRAKIQHMLEHKAAYPDDTEFLALFNFPTHVETEDDISRVAVDSSEVGGKCVQLASEIRGTLRSAPGRRNANRGEGTRDTEVGKSGRKRVRWEDEEEEEEGEEGEEAEEVRQLEEEEEREDEGEEDDESEAIGE
uniref:Transcription factor tfiiic complex a box associated subunit sfc1 n=1 Tax=Coccidioides posadasii RMSCC 3488 TaxID=454284 RepID=A0A0J6I7P7_COCPO|nr:LOW QUALITY PROTEIN: transcription factor tfiiic complex a box associated subunit sfc1 [Coccidioides posadasii RMSCC 3488]